MMLHSKQLNIILAVIIAALLSVIIYMTWKDNAHTASWQDAALMQQHPNPTKPWNPTATQETVTPGQETTPPANTPVQNNTVTPPVPTSPPPTAGEVPYGQEFKLKPGQTALHGDLTLNSIQGNTAQVTFGCHDLKHDYTISVGDGLGMKPECINALYFVRVEDGQAVFIAHMVK